jgi:hypothetical protein
MEDLQASVSAEWHLVALYYSTGLCNANTDYTNVIVSVDSNVTHLGTLLITVTPHIELLKYLRHTMLNAGLHGGVISVMMCIFSYCKRT